MSGFLFTNVRFFQIQCPVFRLKRHQYTYHDSEARFSHLTRDFLRRAQDILSFHERQVLNFYNLLSQGHS